MKDTDRFAELIRNAKRIAVLTGAGMSTESGIPDFRSPSGLYRTVTSEELFDISAFATRYKEFYEVMGPFYIAMMEARPNAGHLALASLEKEFGKEVTVATQNIDGLHTEAGSSKVFEVHGTMATLSCRRCGCQRPHTEFVEVFRAGQVPRCPECKDVMRPDIVFFGENLPEKALDGSMGAFENCDLAIVLGTSLNVYPAAGLPSLRKRGIPLVIVNRDTTPADGSATLVFHDSIGTVLEETLAELRK